MNKEISNRPFYLDLIDYSTYPLVLPPPGVRQSAPNVAEDRSGSIHLGADGPRRPWLCTPDQSECRLDQMEPGSLGNNGKVRGLQRGLPLEGSPNQKWTQVLLINNN